MDTHAYTPHPADLSKMELPTELLPLVEEIARNVHEVWSQGRLNDGWVYGPVRDDAKRTTPCLVPYEQLTEEEKAFDRNTAIGTIKFILSKGFKLTK